jgi:hypothetical protein
MKVKEVLAGLALDDGLIDYLAKTQKSLMEMLEASGAKRSKLMTSEKKMAKEFGFKPAQVQMALQAIARAYDAEFPKKRGRKPKVAPVAPEAPKKRGRKPKVAPPAGGEGIYDDFTAEAPAPKRKRPQVAPAPKRKRPQVAPEAPKRKRPQVAPAPKRKRPQVAPEIPKAQEVTIALTKEDKKRTRGMKKHIATKEDLKKIGSNVVRAIKNVHIALDKDNKKREPEVIDMKRVLSEIYRDVGVTGYSLVDLVKEADREE